VLEAAGCAAAWSRVPEMPTKGKFRQRQRVWPVTQALVEMQGILNCQDQCVLRVTRSARGRASSPYGGRGSGGGRLLLAGTAARTGDDLLLVGADGSGLGIPCDADQLESWLTSSLKKMSGGSVTPASCIAFCRCSDWPYSRALARSHLKSMNTRLGSLSSRNAALPQNHRPCGSRRPYRTPLSICRSQRSSFGRNV
jgi:hypothetical protein